MLYYPDPLYCNSCLVLFLLSLIPMISGPCTCLRPLLCSNPSIRVFPEVAICA